MRETSSYQRIVQTVKEMVRRLRDGELPHGYLEYITSKSTKDDITSLLTLEDKVTKSEMNRCWNQIQCCFETEVEKILSSC